MKKKEKYESINKLYELLIDDAADLEDSILDLINHPDEINNISDFSELIALLNNPSHIEPLLKQIAKGKVGDQWLLGFLYAVIQLLHIAPESLDFYAPLELFEKLSNWLLNTTGEYAWKASSLLGFYDSDIAIDVFLQKLNNHALQNDANWTYTNCLTGLLARNETKYLPLVREIAEDPNRKPRLREACKDMLNKAGVAMN